MLRQQPALAEALNDEYVQQKRWKAWKVAFCAILVCQGVIILINLLAPFDAGIGAQITIWVAVVSSIGAFLHLDRESEDA
jgi:Na+/melibiose symporter-like transporter